MRSEQVKMTRIQVAQIKSILTAQGLEVHPYVNYSGRGMCGAECVGFVVKASAADIFALANAIADVLIVDGDQTEYDELVERTEQDDMGFDTIVYFPGVTYEA